VFCSNFVPKFLRYSTCKYTLKPVLWVTQCHWNWHWSIRHLWFPINVPSQLLAYLLPFPRKMAISVGNRKIFPPPCILRPRWRGSLWNWVPALGSKTRMTGLPGREISLTISLAVCIQYTNVKDRQTDARRKQRPLTIDSRRDWKSPISYPSLFVSDSACAVLP